MRNVLVLPGWRVDRRDDVGSAGGGAMRAPAATDAGSRAATGSDEGRRVEEQPDRVARSEANVTGRNVPAGSGEEQHAYTPER